MRRTDIRSVGPQPPKIERPCFICNKGLNGRSYCYNCGNTKDLVGGFTGSQKGRTSSEITLALGSTTKLTVGFEYRVKLTGGKEFTGICEWKSGPFAYIGGHDVNILEIKEIEIK